MIHEVYYIERVVKRIKIDATDALDAGRSVIMERRDIDYSKAELVDSAIWAIHKVVPSGELS
jgi:hypothetical protein